MTKWQWGENQSYKYFVFAVRLLRWESPSHRKLRHLRILREMNR